MLLKQEFREYEKGTFIYSVWMDVEVDLCLRVWLKAESKED